MDNFTFYNPVKIIFGKGQIKTLAQEIPQDKRILITYGGGSIKKNGVYNQVKQALKGYVIYEFGDIEPNPKYETLMRAVRFCRDHNIDFLLAVGGGSVIDGTKFIAAAVDFKGEPWDLVIKKAPFTKALLIGTVLTIPAAGSEMNCNSVISKVDSQDKIALVNPLLFPKFSILDPQTTYTLPAKQTANGIIDAFVHVMENYLTYPAQALLQERMAEGILTTLIAEGPKALNDPENYDVRANIMWCAAMALNGLLATGVSGDWSSHRIGHEITALYGLDHAETLAILLPSVMHIKREQKRDKILQYAERIWNVNNETQAIAKTREFFESLGVKTHLSDYDITTEAIPKLLAQLERHGHTALGEHQDITLSQSEEILKHSL